MPCPCEYSDPSFGERFFGDLFFNLFSSRFVKRSDCGEWNDFWMNVYQLSNLGIWVCYMLIGGLMIFRRKRDLTVEISPKQKALIQWSYGLFIIMCGFGHLFDGVLAFVYPHYHLTALWHLLTFFVSASSVWVTFKHRMSLIQGI